MLVGELKKILDKYPENLEATIDWEGITYAIEDIEIQARMHEEVFDKFGYTCHEPEKPLDVVAIVAYA